MKGVLEVDGHLCQRREIYVRKDLGMLVECSKKVSTQCALAVKVANSMLEIIKNGIENKRPILCHCTNLWLHLECGILRVVLVTTSQKGHSRARKGAEKSHQSDDWAK